MGKARVTPNAAGEMGVGRGELEDSVALQQRCYQGGGKTREF